MMGRELDGKTALLTGPASGFGAACAQALADAGADLVLADLKDPEESGTSDSWVICDVADESQVKEMVPE